MSHLTTIHPLEFSIEGGKIYAERIIPHLPAAQDLPTLVFLHEGLGSVRHWRDFPSAVVHETGCPALVYDRLGYGRSDVAPKPRSLRYMEEEAFESVPQVLQAANIQRAIFIGHSDGGSIALLFAARYPQLTQALITEAAHVFVEEITTQGIREAVEIYKTTNLPEKLARYHGDKTEKVFSAWADTWLSPEFATWNIEQYLTAIHAPLLVMQGLDDEYGTIRQVDAIASQVSGAVTRCLVPQCAHIPHQQARDVVFQYMCDFIKTQL
jgi:pimeloyl-ACP methyl ester carboxylesterase